MPELILLDLKMPRADGLEILKWIRSSDACSATQGTGIIRFGTARGHSPSLRHGRKLVFRQAYRFRALVELVRNIKAFWLKASPPAGTVQSPNQGGESSDSSLTA